MRVPPSRLLLAVALVVGAVVSCDSPSPFEPVGAGERVALDSEIIGEVAGDTARYSFVAEEDESFGIFLSALEGSVRLLVTDSVHFYTAASLTAGPGSPPLYENGASILPMPTLEGVYHIRVAASPSSGHARFRFVVHRVRSPPETLATTFSIGDTVAGETIDPMVDVDVFFAHGEAGQEIVAVAEAPGPVGAGTVELQISDPVGQQVLGTVYADAGNTALKTTPRIRLQGARDYRFVLSSVIVNQGPRYRGPYRFWTYTIDRAPEHRAAPIAFDTEIADETIDPAGDVDELTFEADAGDLFNVFVQAPRAFQLEVAGPGAGTLASVIAVPTDTALHRQATGRFSATQTGTHVVRVTGSGLGGVADTGAYRVYVYAIDPNPENAQASVVPADTVNEDIALPGDIDEFTFAGAVGEEFNAFLQALDGAAEGALQLDVLGPDGSALASVQSIGTDTTLFRQPTGRFALPSTGTYRLRVGGSPNYPDLYRGPYRLFLYRVDPRPESVPETLVFGESISGEAIDLPGDFDEFQITVPDSSLANVVLEIESEPVTEQSLDAMLIQEGLPDPVVTATAYPDTPAQSGRFEVGPGTYVLRVETPSVSPLSYRLVVYRFEVAPETAADSIAIGDTISVEAIDLPGDMDRFYFHGAAGDHIELALQGQSTSVEVDAGFSAYLMRPSGPPLASLGATMSSGSLDEHRSLRMDLGETGWYVLDVSGASIPALLSEVGGYRLAITRTPSGPEQVSASMVPGDSVTTESLDYLGDWDEFTVSATPGQDLGLLFEATSVGFDFAKVLAVDPATGDSLASNIGQFLRFAGPFRVPDGGAVKVAVFEPSPNYRECFPGYCEDIFQLAGGYKVRVVPVNRAPETAMPAYVVGDTVRGEAIDGLGDSDEFTTSATPGASLSVHWRLLANPVSTGGPVPETSRIWVDVLDPETGTVLTTGGLFNGSPTAAFGSLGTVVVPPSGSLLLRFRGYNESGYELATAPYEFFVRP